MAAGEHLGGLSALPVTAAAGKPALVFHALDNYVNVTFFGYHKPMTRPAPRLALEQKPADQANDIVNEQVLRMFLSKLLSKFSACCQKPVPASIKATICCPVIFRNRRWLPVTHPQFSGNVGRLFGGSSLGGYLAALRLLYSPSI